MKLLRLAAWTVWFVLGWTALAHAGPIAAGISLLSGILAKGGIGAALIKLALGTALKFGVTYLQQAMAGRRERPGINAQVQIGGANSFAFIVGTYATAGQLEYVKTIGSAGDGTPNACLVQVITLSDLPVTSISNTPWIDGAKVTRNTSVTDATSLPYFGPGSYPFNEYFWHKWYFLFAKYRLGNETTADPQLVARCGAGDNPWQSDMIGRGLAQVILTAEIREEFFSGMPSGRWEVQGIKLYDPRKDSTVGGSGSHRWGQPATYEFSDNPVVIIYNLLRGIFYDGQLVYGPAIPATRMPLASWFAAMNECDVPVALAGGGTERQFRSGLEIKAGEDQPIDVIRELLKSCNGKMVENGGVYKIKVGAPGLPVYFVNDESFVVTDEQEFNPFPGLENTFNGASATYPEPASGWEMKDAPQRLFPEFVAEDDGRELLADFQFNAVPFPTQVQRLMASMVRDARRFREHRGTLGPAAFVLEPLDVISWTSAREGYSSKIFQIESMDDQVNGNQSVALRETDPSDFDWNFSTDELPWSVGTLNPQWPAPQLLAGWAVAPAIIYDNAGRARRPSIEVFFDGGLQDVEAVRVVVRNYVDKVTVFDGDLSYDYDPDVPLRSVILNSHLILNDEEYEVSGILVPKSARRVEWSQWLYVKTDNLRLGDHDVYLPGLVDELEQWVDDRIDWLDADSPLYPLGQSIYQVDQKVDIMEAELSGLVGAADFDPLTTYAEGDIVRYDGGLYRASQATTGNLPSDSVYWEKVGDYASLGDAVVALQGRIIEAESEIERGQDGFRSTTRDSRRIYSALMSDAIGEIDKAGATVMEARDRLDASAAVAQWTETEISRVDGVLNIHAADITQVQATLGTKADISVTQALQVQITQQGEDIVSQGGLITAVQNSLGNLSTNLTNNYYTKTQTDGVASTAASSATTALSSTLSPQIAAADGKATAADGKANTALGALGSYTGSGAVATAITSLNTSVSNVNNVVSAQATSIQDLFASLGGSTNQVRVKFDAMTGPAGYSRLGIVARTTGFADRAASAFVDVPNNAALPTRWLFEAEQFIIRATGYEHKPFVFENGGITAHFARLAEVTADLVKTPTNKARFGLLAPGVEGLEVTT